jgi:long-chain acyl-CoA synthetase
VLHLRLGKLLFKSVSRQLGLENLHFFISGGGPIAKEIIDGMEALGLNTYQGYGLTETSPVISATCPAHNKPGSVGLPLVNVQVRIDSPDENGNGEIVVRGPAVMQGYLGMPEKTREVIDPDGWLHTGDLGRQDSDGYLFITGRLKNIIVTKGGKNIYPEEIENLLLQSPLIQECLIIGKLDKEGGEYPHAIIYPNPDALKAMEQEAGKPFTDEETRKIVRGEIQRTTAGAAVYKIPHGFDVSKEELPKTSSSKVKRFLFAEQKKG